MAIQVWIENGRTITLKELIDIVPKGVAAKELEQLKADLAACQQELALSESRAADLAGQVARLEEGK